MANPEIQLVAVDQGKEPQLQLVYRVARLALELQILRADRSRREGQFWSCRLRLEVQKEIGCIPWEAAVLLRVQGEEHHIAVVEVQRVALGLEQVDTHQLADKDWPQTKHKDWIVEQAQQVVECL